MTRIVKKKRPTPEAERRCRDNEACNKWKVNRPPPPPPPPPPKKKKKAPPKKQTAKNKTKQNKTKQKKKTASVEEKLLISM